jgi:hypothetical protein
MAQTDPKFFVKTRKSRDDDRKLLIWCLIPKLAQANVTLYQGMQLDLGDEQADILAKDFRGKTSAREKRQETGASRWS